MISLNLHTPVHASLLGGMAGVFCFSAVALADHNPAIPVHLHPSPESMTGGTPAGKSDFQLSLRLFTPAERAANTAGPEQPAGLQPKEWPWTSIGRVNVESVGHCTGALIAPDRVLTARHCLRNNRTGRLVAPRQVFFLAGYALGDFTARAAVQQFDLPDQVRVTAATGKETDAERAASDWVVLRLTAALAERPIPLALLDDATIRDHAKEGTRFFRAGYPRERPHMLRLQGGCQIVGTGLAGRAALYDCGTMHGESGGPVLLECRGQWRLAAINVGGAVLQNRQVALGIVPAVNEVGLTAAPGVCPLG